MTRLALGVWGCYAQLDFSPAQSIKDANFVVMFGDTDHWWFNHKTKVLIKDDYCNDKFDGEGGK